MPEQTFHTADQIARRLGVSRRTILTWASRGLIPSVRPTAKVVRFNWGDVFDALRQAAPSEGRTGSQ